MTFLGGFLDVLFRAWGFIGLALCVGGVAFRYVVLRGRKDARLCRRAAGITAVGAALVVVCQVLALIVGPWSMADDQGNWPWRAYLATTFARASIVHAAAALGLAVAALVAWRRPLSRAAWIGSALLAVAVMASGGPLTHGASRLSHVLVLMSVTVLHQLPAVIWVGGTVHLVGQWRLLRKADAADQTWPRLVARFSPLAIVCVWSLLAAGLYLAFEYVAGARGLFGTTYGVMLLTKIILMLAAGLLGASNFLSVRRWRGEPASPAIRWRLPALIEAEALIGVCILMAAAAFTGQPPAADLRDDWASPSEVAYALAPKVPQFRLPPFREMVAESTLALDAYTPARPLEKIQSNFNHNVSGAVVLLAGLGAFLFRSGRVRWARHWPLAFVPLGLFVFVSEPTVWPVGPESFWATLASPEVIVHRLAGILAVRLAVFEWRVAAGSLAHTAARYVFPVICLVGGALLLSHSHSVFVNRWSFLIEISHNAVGICAVFAGAARLLELRLPLPERRVAGAIWPVCLSLLGMVLLFYRET